MVRTKGLYLKVNKWLKELEENPDNRIDVKYQLDNFMHGIFYQRYKTKNFMFPFYDMKTIKYEWMNQELHIKPFIPSLNQLKEYLMELRSLILQDLINGRI